MLPRSPLWAAEALNCALQLAGFVLAAPLRTVSRAPLPAPVSRRAAGEKFYDAFGCLGFLLTVSYSFFASSGPEGPHSARSVLATATTLLWSLRLGSFLLRRVLASRNGDSRFEIIKRSPPAFFVAWAGQAAWVAVTSSPVVLVNVLDSRTFAPLGALDYAGLALWTVGFAIEVVSDRQKSAFNARQRDMKEKRWIEEGLWKYSRTCNLGFWAFPELEGQAALLRTPALFRNAWCLLCHCCCDCQTRPSQLLWRGNKDVLLANQFLTRARALLTAACLRLATRMSGRCSCGSASTCFATRGLNMPRSRSF
ncbi:MAG: hypothetical protein BJ554DRAFT_3954 [Olpidium bornovanus]|uniref:DUF1295 domain-containing protein n=1 Tax=Olpidium bornovanus TaxID=278681 RepID=A0A8H8DFK5_9FUNG|nr:MAG: hypothetical protein BJ554DRAFT_3954 [Olpidium bornovanus]